MRLPFVSPHPPILVPDQAFGDFVLATALKRPQALALVDAITGRRLTYGALLDATRCAAAGLAGLGIRRGDVVALMLPNCPEFAIAFHAVLRLGAIVTPVNPAYTPNELAFQLQDANAQLLITTSAATAVAQAAIETCGWSITLITIDETPGVSSLRAISRDADPPAVNIDPSDVAVLPYSSGTTGLPKGVMLTHRNLVANLVQLDAIEHPDLHALVAVLPFFHIYGMVVILNFGLMRGLTLITLPRFELEPFLRVLQEWAIELAHIVPPVAVALAKHPVVDNYRLPHLKWLLCAAAPLGAEVTEALQLRLGVGMRQGYGMTEASPATHYTGYLPGAARAGKTGVLLPSTECRIVDLETGMDRGQDESGEVWIRGPQVMKGYLNNPEATARTVDKEGWLHTGDIGTMDSEGYLSIQDRLKELIKVKGFQVAPAEIEALLLQHPQIVDAAVIPVPDDQAGEVPKAIVVLRAGPAERLTEQDVKAYLHPQVAHYKRLAFVEFVEAIPKSASGKILRRVLVERERART
jgi:acyl-CoA synthetase (AMP-forming)/AMP-acid ligase II